MTTICRKCGKEIPGGTLLTHERAEHPKPVAPTTARKPRTCYAEKCKDFYGAGGHIVGVTGPHVH